MILVKGRAGIEEFSEAAIHDPIVLDLARRTEYVVDDSLPFPQAFPGWIRIRLKDGRLIEARMDASRGSREIPMTPDELREKFTANAVRTLPKDRVDALWNAGHRLESIRDITEFSSLTTL